MLAPFCTRLFHHATTFPIHMLIKRKELQFEKKKRLEILDSLTHRVAGIIKGDFYGSIFHKPEVYLNARPPDSADRLTPWLLAPSELSFPSGWHKSHDVNPLVEVRFFMART